MMNEDVGLENYARALEDSGDYRVLRKFKEDQLHDLLSTLRVDNPVVGSLKVLVIDVETTGLDPEHDEVIEIGIIGNFEGALYGGMQQPSNPIEQVITDITGITNDELEGKEIDWGGVDNLIENADYVIAHNAGFDRKFVERYAHMAKFAKWICSVEDVDYGHDKRDLTAVAGRAGVFFDAHRAIEDAMVTLYTIIKNGSIHGLLEHADEPYYRAMALGSPFRCKDTLKDRGYKWHPGDAHNVKTWHKKVSISELAEEQFFLKGITTTAKFTPIQPEDKYSVRDI